MATVISGKEYFELLKKKQRSIAIKWGVSIGQVEELFDLYQAHKELDGAQTLAIFEQFKSYNQANMIVRTVCVGG